MHSYTAKAAFFVLAGLVALGLVALAWAIGPGSSEAQQGAMHNCPQAGKWAISVWGGDDGTDTGQALETCGPGTVDFAYYLDPATNYWLAYFEGQPLISKLLTLDNMQGVLAHGAVAAQQPSPTASPTPTPTATATAAPTPTATPTPSPTPSPRATATATPRICCKYCTTGKACGDTCISRKHTCHQPPGCACNA